MGVAYKVRHRSRPTARNASAEAGTDQAKDDEPLVSPSETRADGNYAVGYGKPPTHTRFRKGRSGNPRGRPKGAKNLKTDLAEELYETILVREGEKAHRVTKQRAILKSLAAKAMKGDTRAIGLVVNIFLRLMSPDNDAVDEQALSDDDRTILEKYEARIRNGAGTSHRANRSKEK